MQNSLKPNEILTGNISWMADNMTPLFKRGFVPVAYIPSFETRNKMPENWDLLTNGDGCYILADISSCLTEEAAKATIQKLKNEIDTQYTDQFYFTDQAGNL